jgi:hypothetical protein
LRNGARDDPNQRHKRSGPEHRRDGIHGRLHTGQFDLSDYNKVSDYN